MSPTIPHTLRTHTSHARSTVDLPPRPRSGTPRHARSPASARTSAHHPQAAARRASTHTSTAFNKHGARLQAGDAHRAGEHVGCGHASVRAALGAAARNRLSQATQVCARGVWCGVVCVCVCVCAHCTHTQSVAAVGACGCMPPTQACFTAHTRTGGRARCWCAWPLRPSTPLTSRPAVHQAACRASQ
jgi:hypothetical protein